jgi:hypothetical protein
MSIPETKIQVKQLVADWVGRRRLDNLLRATTLNVMHPVEFDRALRHQLVQMQPHRILLDRINPDQIVIFAEDYSSLDDLLKRSRLR